MSVRSGTILRDPVWDTVHLDAAAMRVADTAAFQRLRYIRQLGLAYLVYPGATHTRFDHAVGVYHLTRRALAGLDERGALAAVSAEDRRLVPLAGLLHDIGHYPFSHAIEELEEGTIPGHHEAVVARFLADETVRDALDAAARGGAARVEALIQGRSESPLQGLVSGSLDLDKIEYLKRDAHFCGVPYGHVDVERLLHAMEVVQDPATGRWEVGVHEKGAAALESLLFAKYQMFRNVYWHHAVRAATVLYKRIVADALEGGLLRPEELLRQTDDGLLSLLEARAGARGEGGAAAAAEPAPEPALADRIGEWVVGLRARRLPKRAAEVVAAELGEEEVGDWLATDSPLKRRVEERIAAELGLAPGAVFLDYPEKPAMFALDVLVVRRRGVVQRLGPGGEVGLIGLPRIAAQLYHSARVLRLFVLGTPAEVERARLLERRGLATLATADAPELARRLDGGGALLR
jgi:uncharacterized protein